MLKLNIVLLIVIAVVLAIPGNTQGYRSLSDDELLEWWDCLGQSERIEWLRTLDRVEHAVPEVRFPGYAAVLLKNGDLVLKPLDKRVVIEIDYLRYEIYLEDLVYEDFYQPEIVPEKGFFDHLIPVLMGVGAGMFGTMLADSARPWQYTLSGLQGAAFGLMFTIFM